VVPPSGERRRDGITFLGGLIMRWVWERRWILLYWGVVLYLLVLAVALAIGTTADVVDPPKPTVVP
jgi:hypothetical protein